MQPATKSPGQADSKFNSHLHSSCDTHHGIDLQCPPRAPFENRQSNGMKIQVLSDLHIEFADYETPSVDADLIVLAGDIGVRMSGLRYAKSLPRPVVYTAGNHEYYGAALPHLTEKLRREADGTNVTFLENAQAVIDGVRFLGCTLWSDFSILGTERRQLAMWEAQQQMTDYRRVRLSPMFRRLRPSDTVSLHRTSVRWLERALATRFSGPTVVVTHHAPTSRSLDPDYLPDYLTGAYVSDLDDLIARSDISVWIHGHTHHCVDFVHENTRILGNQRGYPDEPVPGFNGSLAIEVS